MNKWFKVNEHCGVNKSCKSLKGLVHESIELAKVLAKKKEKKESERGSEKEIDKSLFSQQI